MTFYEFQVKYFRITVTLHFAWECYLQVLLIEAFNNQIILRMRNPRIQGLLLLLFITATYQETQFCWKDSYGRGVGTIPNGCPANKELIGLLCYTRCPAGYRRSGFACIDDGDWCRLAEYGRGTGYPWQIFDPLDDSGMFRRCQNDHGKGKCQKNGLIVYPKCDPGYNSVGCCICRPDSFSCSSYQLGEQFDLSCKKKRIEDPTPMVCRSNLEQQAGLCYNFCQKGYYGVGPVCWANVPAGWVDCGMGAAKNSSVCAQIISGQIKSVLQLAATIVTFGTSGAASAAGKAGKLTNEVVDTLKKGFDQLKKVYKAGEPFFEQISKYQKAQKTAKTANNFIDLLLSPNPDPADIVRVTAEIISLFDPTGVAGVVAQYSHPICSRVFPK